MSESIYREVVAGWSEKERGRFTRAQFEYREQTGSTNDDLLEKLRAREAGDFHLVVADSQNRGRGRRGDRWEGGTGRNLLFSLSLRLGPDREKWSRLPHLAAYMVGQAVESILPPGNRLEAKWPNDLLCDGRKMAGILVETTFTPEPYAIIGVGLNVNLRLEELPQELRDTSTSLYEVLGCESNRWFVLGLILQNWLRIDPDINTIFPDILDWIGSRDFLSGRNIRVITASGSVEGTAVGIGEEGELLVCDSEDRVHHIISSEKIEVC